MNCGNCGTPLIPGNSICPKCGAMNVGINGTPLNQPVNPETSIPQTVSNQVVNNNVSSVVSQMPVNTSEHASMSTGVVNNENTVTDFNDQVNNIPLYEEVKEEVKEETIIPEDIVNITDQTDNVSDVQVSEEIQVADLSNEINKKKKFKLKINTNKKIPLIICLGGIALAAVLGIFLGSSMFSKNYCAVANRTFNEETQVVADGKNNITQVDHFIYKIPNIYMYDRQNGGVSVYDKSSTYKIFIKSVQGNYVNIASTKTSVKATLEEQDIKVNTIKEMKVGETNYLIVEVATKNVNRMLVFTDATKGYVYYSEITNNTNEYNYDVIKILDDILKNASYSEKVVSDMEKIDIVDPSKVVVKTAEEFNNKVK